MLSSLLSVTATTTVSSALSLATGKNSSGDGGGDGEHRFQDQTKGQRDLLTQVIVSCTVGFLAFMGFCVRFRFGNFLSLPLCFFELVCLAWENANCLVKILRPKWRELYAARRRLRTAASRLPELPDTLFGWIPIVHKISDDEVLASAGLDAFVVSS